MTYLPDPIEQMENAAERDYFDALKNWTVKTQRHHNALSIEEMDLVLECQRDLVLGNRGVFGLTDDLEFLFAYHPARGVPFGVLGWRPNGDEVWVQLAFVDPNWREMGAFRALVQSLESQHPGRRIGFGVWKQNAPMLFAMDKLGYSSQTLYFYKTVPEATR